MPFLHKTQAPISYPDLQDHGWPQNRFPEKFVLCFVLLEYCVHTDSNHKCAWTVPRITDGQLTMQQGLGFRSFEHGVTMNVDLPTDHGSPLLVQNLKVWVFSFFILSCKLDKLQGHLLSGHIFEFTTKVWNFEVLTLETSCECYWCLMLNKKEILDRQKIENVHN